MEARDRALRYLNARMCSVQQMRDYLRRKGHEDEEIEEAIRDLEEYRYLDDRRYAAAFMESGLEKGRGMLRIRRELKQKGVADEVIEEAAEALEDVPDEFDVAFAHAQAILAGVDTGKLEYAEREKWKARIARRLAGKGFSSDTIYRVIGRIM
ncbi:MAG: regulatory protein RecX [Firmicutes bacterium]|nr:regulatory protein RecX [Bacillota bacterium]